jgi:hypothetical protein
MKFPSTTVLGAFLALAASANALAMPNNPGGQCTPGQYSCTTPLDVTAHYIYACNTLGQWIPAADCVCDGCCHPAGANRVPYCNK